MDLHRLDRSSNVAEKPAGRPAADQEVRPQPFHVRIDQPNRLGQRGPALPAQRGQGLFASNHHGGDIRLHLVDEIRVQKGSCERRPSFDEHVGDLVLGEVLEESPEIDPLAVTRADPNLSPRLFAAPCGVFRKRAG